MHSVLHSVLSIDTFRCGCPVSIDGLAFAYAPARRTPPARRLASGSPSGLPSVSWVERKPAPHVPPTLRYRPSLQIPRPAISSRVLPRPLVHLQPPGWKHRKPTGPTGPTGPGSPRLPAPRDLPAAWHPGLTSGIEFGCAPIAPRAHLGAGLVQPASSPNISGRSENKFVCFTTHLSRPG